MKDRIRINKVYIKTGVLAWIALSFIILFISVSPTEAGNTTIIQDDTGNSLTGKTVLEISGSDLEKVVKDLEKEIELKNNADSHEDSVDSVQKDGEASGTDTSKSDSPDRKGKTTDSNEAKNSGSQKVNRDKEKAVDNDVKAQEAANTNPDQESIADDAAKSVREDETSPEQTTVKKSDASTSKDNIVGSKQKDDSGISKATKSQTDAETTTASKVTEVTYKNNNGLSCKTRSIPASSTEKIQKNISNPGSCSIISGSNSSSNNSGSNSSGNYSGVNSSDNESGINSNITDPGINSNGTDLGINSISTDTDLDSGGKSFGSVHIIHTPYSVPDSEGSKSIMNTAEAVGLKDLQPKIEGNLAKASLINGPSKSGSFLIGFIGMLLILFTMVRLRK